MSAPFAAEPQALRIFGIAKFIVGTNSVQVTKDESIPYAQDLVLISSGGGSESGVKSLTVNIGDSFTITDRHHVSTAYRLIGVSGDVAEIEEVHWTHFADRGEHSSTNTVLVRTYGDR